MDLFALIRKRVRRVSTDLHFWTILLIVNFEFVVDVVVVFPRTYISKRCQCLT